MRFLVQSKQLKIQQVSFVSQSFIHKVMRYQQEPTVGQVGNFSSGSGTAGTKDTLAGTITRHQVQ